MKNTVTIKFTNMTEFFQLPVSQILQTPLVPLCIVTIVIRILLSDRAKKFLSTFGDNKLILNKLN